MRFTKKPHWSGYQFIVTGLRRQSTLFSNFVIAGTYFNQVGAMYGELTPKGGGDPVPLLKKSLLVGRRESCDIVLRFGNVSAHHCQLTCHAGYWYVKDLNSRNGTKVNGFRVTQKRLDPGDTLGIAKHKYEVAYSPMDLGAVGPPPVDDLHEDIMGESLLARAGLERTDEKKKRYEVLDDSAGQIRDRNKPT